MRTSLIHCQTVFQREPNGRSTVEPTPEMKKAGLWPAFSDRPQSNSERAVYFCDRTHLARIAASFSDTLAFGGIGT